MNRVNPAIEEYISRHIIPAYRGFDEAHQMEHAQTVVENSMLIAADYPVDMNMVYVIAAYHDMGLGGGRENHEKRSAEILLSNRELGKWFTVDDIQIMAEAAEDHRASNKHTPRSIYGKIVAEADRDIEYGRIRKRCIQYSLRQFPEYDERQHYERTYSHMREKYGEEGYLVLWLDTQRNRENLTELRRKLHREDEFRRDFHTVFHERAANTENS